MLALWTLIGLGLLLAFMASALWLCATTPRREGDGPPRGVVVTWVVLALLLLLWLRAWISRIPDLGLWRPARPCRARPRASLCRHPTETGQIDLRALVGVTPLDLFRAGWRPADWRAGMTLIFDADGHLSSVNTCPEDHSMHEPGRVTR